MTLYRLLLALAVTALVAGAAFADDAALRSAKRHFERGEKLYALAKFGDALDEYQKAFDARPLPEFLFNIGQCYRNLGDYDSAIFSYRKYLTLARDASNREQVEQLIADLQAKLDAKKQQATSAQLGLQRPPPAPPGPPAPPPQPAARPLYKQWWLWTGIAVIGAGSVAIYEVARSNGAPSTTLGNIVFGK